MEEQTKPLLVNIINEKIKKLEEENEKNKKLVKELEEENEKSKELVKKLEEENEKLRKLVKIKNKMTIDNFLKYILTDLLKHSIFILITIFF